MGKGSADVNHGYLRSPDGILKIIELILSFIIFVLGCVIQSWAWFDWSHARSGWLIFSGIVAFIVVLMFFLLKLLGHITRLPASVPWGLVEFILNVVFAIFFLICGIICCVPTWVFRYEIYAACCILSFLDMLAFIINAYFLYRDWRAGGVTVVTKTTTTTTDHA